VKSRGYYVSFGPALLYSRKLQRMASGLDPALVLVESDGPVTFAPLGGAGGPALIPTVVFKLAELWNLTFSEAEDRILRNGLSYLGTGEKT
jgi:TatD DNase family protein